MTCAGVRGEGGGPRRGPARRANRRSPASGAERPIALLVALPAGDGPDTMQLGPLSGLDHLPGLAGGIARQVAELLAEIVAGTSHARAPRGRGAQAPLEAIEYVARRASELVHHLVVCAGEEIVEGEALDLTALVERLRGELTAMLPPGIELHFRVTPHLPPIVGDPAQLRQVLAQLVTNSAEALEGRRGVISVATGLVDADRAYLARTYFDDGLPEGRYLFLEVSDTGRGMDAATLAQVFEPQFSSKGAGRGLGLALVQGIVRAHHGAVQVYSKPDVGTTVRVLLPTAGSRGRYSVQEAREQPAVLIVDHDSAVRGTGARILEQWGYGVIEAGDVTEGVELLRERPSVQLVVLEAGLRGAAGPEALRGAREGVRVLLAGEINGSGNLGDAVEVVSRPFAPVELVRAVRAALGALGRNGGGQTSEQG
jgi:CheY-like chemotaxis protein/two-component sensor histidine kinase